MGNKQEIEEYYTPNEDELYIGYELQWLNEKQEWENKVLDKYGFGIDVKWFRAKYLCKQDIIDLGFTTPPYTQIEGYEYYKFLRDSTEVRIILNGYEDYSKIKIKYDLDTVFDGVCKSANELKKLMKDYLNIPI